jgi:hypothetical protein
MSGVGVSSDWPNWVPHVAYCDWHEKKAFEKRAAKAAIRQMHGKGMREYPCEVMAGLWHVGHLPRVIRVGEMTVAEVFGPRR